jgi:DNA-binding NarL/FixJ family response regulator
MSERRLRVLLAEKRLSETAIILRSLCAEAGWILEMVLVSDREEVGTALKAHCPDVALVDLSLLQPEAAAHLGRLHLASLAIPIILFAEPADEVFAVECLSVGARDYLLEGFMDERTVAHVLQSAMSGGDVGPTPCAARREECVVSVRWEALDEMQQDQDKKELHDLIKMLKRNVRTSDQVVSRGCGQIDLVMADRNEEYLGAIVQRIGTRMKSYTKMQSQNLATLVTIREGRGYRLSKHCGVTELGAPQKKLRSELRVDA